MKENEGRKQDPGWNTDPVELVEEHPEDEKHEEDGETDGDDQPIGGGLPPTRGGTFQVGCKETRITKETDLRQSANRRMTCGGTFQVGWVEAL